MDLNRTNLPASLATAAVTGLGAIALTRFMDRRKAREKDRIHWRTQTGGCRPDFGAYMDDQVIVHGVDGTHQGLAVAMLRDKFLVAETAPEDLEPVEPLELEYEEAFRSAVEVAINVALNLAEDDATGTCECGDSECQTPAVEPSLWPLIAGSKMVKFALMFESAARAHAAGCRECAAAGKSAPTYLRARFCRDLSDQLLTNYFTSDSASMRGVPVNAAVDVVVEMMRFRAADAGISTADQLTHLTTSVAYAVANVEAGQTPNAA